jgi:hypothetical protein
MIKKTRKYNFTNEAAADAAIAALPHDEDGNPTHNNAIVKLGYLVDTPATYDEEGNELTAAVLKTEYAVDVYWDGEPLEAWNQYIVFPLPMGIHSFGSSSSRDEYAKTYCELFPDSLYCNPPEPTEEELL